MSFIKKYFKIFVGVAVLMMAIVVFLVSQRSGDLTNKNLDSWRSASLDSRVAAIQILTGGNGAIDGIVICVDKIATLEDAEKMSVRTAAALCHTGMQIKQNL